MTRKIFAVLLAAILLCFMGCTAPDGNMPADPSAAIDNSAADTYLSMAQTFIDSGDLEAARTILKEAIEKCDDQRIKDMLLDVNEKLLSEKEVAATTAVVTEATTVATTEATTVATTEATTVATEATESPEVKAKYDKYAGKWRNTDFSEYVVNLSFDKDNIYVSGSYEDFMSGYKYSFNASADKSTFFEYGCKIKFKDMEGSQNVVLLKPKSVKYNDGTKNYIEWTYESIDGIAGAYDAVKLYRDKEHDTMLARALALESAGTYDNGAFEIKVSGTQLHFYYEESQGGFDRFVSVDHTADVSDFVGDTLSFKFEDSWGNKGTMKIRLFNAPGGRCANVIISDMVYDDYAMLSVSEGDYVFVSDSTW